MRTNRLYQAFASPDDKGREVMSTERNEGDPGFVEEQDLRFSNLPRMVYGYTDNTDNGEGA